MDTLDFLAFSLTVFFISRSKKGGHKLSIMLRTIVEDATRYFLFIFTSHIALAMILSFGRVRLATALLYLPPPMIFNACLSRNQSNIFQLQLREWFLASS
jgi:hypothetical protein